MRSVEEWIAYFDDGRIANIYTFEEDGTITTQVINTKYEDNYRYSTGQRAEGKMALSIKYSWNWERQPYIEIEKSVNEMGAFSRYGKWIQYNKDGTFGQTGEYDWKTNKPRGEWKVYKSDGSLRRVVVYPEADSLKEIWRHYYEDGSLKNIGEIVDNHYNGLFTAYFKSGKVMSHGHHNGTNDDGKTAKRVGKWKFLYENGDLKEVANYENGKLHNIHIEYYKNQKVKMKSEFYQDKVIAHWINFWKMAPKF